MRTASVIFTLVSILLLCSCSNTGMSSGEYEVVHGWPQLPEGFVLGQVSGVEVDSHGHVFVFHRAEGGSIPGLAEGAIGGQTILCLDGQSGELLSAWGENMFLTPHGLDVDHENNVWVTDVGLHQVLKFSHEGELLLTLGEKGVPGLDGQHFDQPTDVVITPAGEIYVSDGYGNSRVATFAADGSFLFDWGKPGDQPGEFNLPHGITLDAQGRVYVADRSNSRIQVFDAKGNFLSEWKSAELGRPWGMDVGPDNFLYVVDGGDLEESIVQRNHILKLDLEGNIIRKWSTFGSYDGQLIWGHDVSVGADGSVFVGDVHYGMRVQKFERR